MDKKKKECLRDLLKHYVIIILKAQFGNIQKDGRTDTQLINEINQKFLAKQRV